MGRVRGNGVHGKDETFVVASRWERVVHFQYDPKMHAHVQIQPYTSFELPLLVPIFHLTPSTSCPLPQQKEIDKHKKDDQYHRKQKEADDKKDQQRRKKSEEKIKVMVLHTQCEGMLNIVTLPSWNVHSCTIYVVCIYI